MAEVAIPETLWRVSSLPSSITVRVGWRTTSLFPAMTPPIPEVLGLTLRDRLHINVERPHIPVDRPTENGQPNGNTRMDGELPPATPPEEGEDRYIRKLKIYAKNLPYSIEPESKMMEILDFILLRLTQCAEAKDYDVGLVQWDSLLS